MSRHLFCHISIVLLVVGSFAACSDDAGGARGNSSDCPDGEVFDDGEGACVSVTNNATANNSAGNNGASDAGGEDGASRNNGGDDAGRDACQPHKKFLAVRQSDIFLLIDRSSSMMGGPMEQAKAALDNVADSLAGQIRIGAAAYPVPSAGCSIKKLVGLGSHSPSDLKAGWANLTAAGGTPTGTALYQVRDRSLLSPEDDPHADVRKKAIVLITDGNPNVCEDEHPAPDEAATFFNAGNDPSIPVYVIGFKSEANPDKLDEIAGAGGTDAPGDRLFYTADDTSTLEEAISEISTTQVACTQTLRPAPPAADGLQVAVDDESVSRGEPHGWTYDAQTGELTLHGDSCDNLQSAAQEGTALEITVHCDGSDCVPTDGSCTDGDDCCSGRCSDGTCDAVCQPSGGECSDNDDCCTGVCANDGGLVGSCTTQ